MVDLEDLRSNIAFKTVDGQVAVAWAIDDKKKRVPYRDGSEENAGYALLPNIEGPKTAMLALQQFPFAALPPILGATEECLGANEAMREAFVPISDVDDAKVLLEAFDLKPTRAKVKEAEEALSIWRSDAETYALVPVRDILAASRDLKAIVSVLLYSMEDDNERHHYCSIEGLRKNVDRGLGFLGQGIDGCERYAEFLRGIEGDDRFSFIEWDCFAPGTSSDMWKAIERGVFPETKRQLKEFASHSINAFLSALRPRIEGTKIVIAGDDVDFSDAYCFWAEKALVGKAGVCAHCNKLFVRAKNTGKYCSRGCATMSNRQ